MSLHDEGCHEWSRRTAGRGIAEQRLVASAARVTVLTCGKFPRANCPARSCDDRVGRTIPSPATAGFIFRFSLVVG